MAGIVGAGGTQVDTGDLLSAASKAQQTSEELTGQVSMVTSRVTELSDSWAGAAQAQYQALYEEWQRGYQAINMALQTIGEKLTAAAQLYGQTEDANASGIAKAGS